MSDETHWLSEVGSPHPTNKRARLIGDKDSGLGSVIVEDHAFRHKQANINELRAITRGGGRQALQEVLRAADKHGVTLTLSAEPLKPHSDHQGKQLSTSKLRSWYHGFGFNPDKGTVMKRTPARILKKAGPFADLLSDLGVLGRSSFMHDDMLKSHDSGVYVFRPVVNNAEWLAWADRNGLVLNSKGGGLHVTVVSSTTTIPWEADENELRLSANRYLGFDILGRDSALVLMLRSPELKKRWALAKDHGATMHHNGCKPHLTLSYTVQEVPPLLPDIPLILGPEEVRDFKSDHKLSSIQPS